MKRFLYAMMAVSSLMISGCGKKEATKAPSADASSMKNNMAACQYVADNDLSDQDLADAMKMLQDLQDSENEYVDEALDEASQAVEDDEEIIAEDLIDDEALKALADLTLKKRDRKEIKKDLNEDEDRLVDDMAEDVIADDELAEMQLEQGLLEALEKMTPEERQAAEEEALRELAAYLNSQKMAAVGEDRFAADMNDAEREQLVAWQNDAEMWAKNELQMAALESKELGFPALTFEEHSATLAPGQDDALESTIRSAKEAVKDGRILVVTAQAKADDENPLELSNARAEYIKNQLVAAGVSAEALHVAGYGASLNDLFDASAASQGQIIVC